MEYAQEYTRCTYDGIKHAVDRLKDFINNSEGWREESTSLVSTRLAGGSVREKVFASFRQAKETTGKM